jgi:predicted transposase YdaD
MVEVNYSFLPFFCTQIIFRTCLLQLLTTLQLNPAQVQLISGFVDTYLELNSQEEVVFQEQLANIEAREQEEVMQIVTSWMRQEEKQGELKLLMRQINRRFGEISPDLKGKIENLSTLELENLGEALLDFSDVADLEAWFESLA